MRIVLHAIGYLVLAALFACSSPTDTCGCTPIPPREAVIYGAAVAEGSPMVGSQVIAVPLDELSRSRLKYQLNRDTILVGPTGIYEGRILAMEPKICLQVGLMPQDEPLDTLWSAAIVAELVFNPNEALRYRVDFVRHPAVP